jgi:hypothetical protein
MLGCRSEISEEGRRCGLGYRRRWSQGGTYNGLERITPKRESRRDNCGVIRRELSKSKPIAYGLVISFRARATGLPRNYFTRTNH